MGGDCSCGTETLPSATDSGMPGVRSALLLGMLPFLSNP